MCCRRGGERTAKRRGQVLLAIESLVIHRTHLKPSARRTARVRLMGWDGMIRGTTCGCDKVGCQSPSSLWPLRRALVAPRETLSSAPSPAHQRSFSWLRDVQVEVDRQHETAQRSAAQHAQARPEPEPEPEPEPKPATLDRPRLHVWPAASTFITPSTKQRPLRHLSLSPLAPLRRISATRVHMEHEMRPHPEPRCSPPNRVPVAAICWSSRVSGV